MLGLFDHVCGGDPVRLVLRQHRQHHLHHAHHNRDAQRTQRSYKDQMQNGSVYHYHDGDLYWQHHHLQAVLPSQLYRWSVPAQGNLANTSDMGPAANFQESDGTLRPNPRAEDHARGKLSSALR